MTLFEFALTAVAVLTSTAWGYLIGRLKGKAKGLTEGHSNGLKAGAALCSCGHGFGTHEDGKSCKAEVKRTRFVKSRSDGFNVDIGDVNGYEWVRCPCRGHDGPLPPAALERIVRDWEPN